MIFSEGSIGDSIYFLFKGKVKILKNKKIIREIDSASYFGELAIMTGKKRSADVYATTNCTIYSLPKDIFFKFLDEKMEKILNKKISLLDVDNIKLEDLVYMNHIGEGKFGTVSLVNNSKNIYAIKSVFRQYAENQKILTKYFQKERKILLSLEHPFIVKLVKTFRNEECIFYLMENVNGISLSKYLQKKPKKNKMDRSEVKFIGACLLSVLDYLNMRKYSHRDIKPDNVVIDERGYVKLIDFGTATEIKDITNTITGTPHYMAPEILMGRGYGFSADYWSIGVTMFEIYFNYFPFGNMALDPMEVYRDVVKR